ncbi:hypothetical protein F5Y06DRAFT_109197 [Hypoxylon sp. FL0890]|nr:hypothetical protein F5Y06DRAFT_109197 [Hypoxylon sp. FL0890]
MKMAQEKWLAFFAPPPGFQGTYLVETRQTFINDISTTVFCFGNIVKRQFLKELEISPHEKENSITLFKKDGFVIADCEVGSMPVLKKIRGGPLPDQERLHHLSTTDPESIFSRLIRPVVPVVLVFVDDIGGTDKSARMLAQWVRASMNDSPISSPRLLVVQREGGTTSRDFCRILHVELLLLLRKSSPERPYSFPEVVQLRKKCFGSVYVVQAEELRASIFSHINEEKEIQRSAGPIYEFYGTFKLLTAHLHEHPGLPFDLFEGMSRADPMPRCSQYYIREYVKLARRLKADPVPHLASCLVTEIASSCFRYYPAEDVFSRRYLPILPAVRSDIHGTQLICRVQAEFRRILRRSQIIGESVIKGHLDTLGNAGVSIDIRFCFSCLLRPSIHALSCHHRLCNKCIALHGNLGVAMTYNLPLCPFCKHPNKRLLYLQPPAAKARVLVLENRSVLSAVSLLRDVRACLFGPIHEYLDLIIGCNDGRSVVKDVFVHGLSTQECLEKHTSRKRPRLSRPRYTQPQSLHLNDKLPGSFQVALWKRNELLTSWGSIIKPRDVR